MGRGLVPRPEGSAFAEEGVYVNFGSDLPENVIVASFGRGKWDRLVAVKREYDPDNVFHHTRTFRRPRRNANVPPA